MKLLSLFLLVAVSTLAGCKANVATSVPRFNSVDSIPAIDFINSRPVPSGAYRVLFIGDSLTVHAAEPELWDRYSGMAATSPQKDFVHLYAASLQGRLADRPIEIFYDNGGDGKVGGMLNYLHSHPALKPDLVVLQGGENDSFDNQFRTTYARLLSFYPRTRVIILGDWWSPEKESFEKGLAHFRHMSFVSLYSIFEDPSAWGDGGPYNNSGVAHHPNDHGMQLIANELIRATGEQ